MADFLSVQSGDWNDVATWGDAAYPGALDTATIAAQHTVTIPVGLAATCGVLILAAGIDAAHTKLNILGQFDMAGNINNATYCELLLWPGAILDLNGFNIVNAGLSAKIYYTFKGSASSFAIVRSTGTRGQFGYTHPSDIISDWQFVDFSGVADGSTIHRSNSASVLFRFYDCVFSDCADLYMGYSVQAAQGMDIKRCVFEDPSSTTKKLPSMLLSATSTVDRILENCVFRSDGVAVAYINIQNLTWKNSVIAGYTVNRRGSTKEISNIFGFTKNGATYFVYPDTTSLLIENSYWYSNTSSHQFPLLRDGDTFRNNVFESTNAGTNTYLVNNLGLTNTFSVYDNLIIGKGTPITFLSGSDASIFDFHNNTIVLDNGSETLFPTLLMTEQLGLLGGDYQLYNNIIVDVYNSTPEYGISLINAAADQLTYADYNNWYGYGTTDEDTHDRFYNVSITGKVEGVDEGFGAFDISVDPLFYDRTRCLATWDLSLGGTGVDTNILAKIESNLINGDYPDYVIADLIEWVKTGFAVQNRLALEAGRNGERIGCRTITVNPVSLGAAVPGYYGRVKYSLLDPPQWPSAPELIAVTGVNNAVYDAAGVGLIFATPALALAAMASLADDTYLFGGTKAAALYSVDMSAKAVVIKRYVGD